mmetsp:Transcript_26064/g.53762  ORF Transcript_26064/g.53762 Transcript_26064/m.53762 type:complete len:499 (-) Transcript_26064:29-1525(-)
MNRRSSTSLLLLMHLPILIMTVTPSKATRFFIGKSPYFGFVGTHRARRVGPESFAAEMISSSSSSILFRPPCSIASCWYGHERRITSWKATSASLSITRRPSSVLFSGFPPSREQTYYRDRHRRLFSSSTFLRSHSSNNNDGNGEQHISRESETSMRTTATATTCTTNYNLQELHLQPFTWPELIGMIRPKHDSHNEGEPNHPNLAALRRSPNTQQVYLKHQSYLKRNWKTAYDYLLVQKFGIDFGFRKVLVEKADDAIEATSQSNVEEQPGGGSKPLTESEVTTAKSNHRSIPPPGFVYRSDPSLREASQYALDHNLSYLRLVPNDFPYHVDERYVEHWCLWKIGGSHSGGNADGTNERFLKGVILPEDIDWALNELECYSLREFDTIDVGDGDGIIIGSSKILKDNAEVIMYKKSLVPDESRDEAEKERDMIKTRTILDSLYWVNPPSLQSMPDIRHAHILILRELPKELDDGGIGNNDSNDGGGGNECLRCPPPV